MRTRSILFGSLVAGLLVASLATGAGAQSASPGESPMSGGLADTEWLLGSVGSTPVVSGTNADLLFSDTDAGGFAGCNRFFASYTTDGTSSLTFGPVATTMIACDDATNAFEQSYLAALATVASYTIGADGGLTLADASGKAVLTYSPQVPATLEGPWNITNVNNGNNGVEPVPDGIGASISFHPDGTVEGFGGCNSFSGGYGVNGESVTIGPLMSTMMACDDATNTFEVQLLTALQNATTWSVTSGTLDLRDDSGAQQVEATSAIGH
jgi:heat shock protein HslJ